MSSAAVPVPRWESAFSRTVEFEDDWRSTEMVVARAVAHGVGVADLSASVLQHLEQLHLLTEGWFALSSGDGLTLLSHRVRGQDAPVESRFLLATSLASLASQRGGAVHTRVADAVDEFPALACHDRTSHVLVVPVMVEEAIFGFFELKRGEPFRSLEIEFVGALAAMVATSLLRERRLEQIARHTELLEARVQRGQEELTRTQEQLLQVAKLSTIGEIAAGLVHEINQPLNVLGGYVELLREGRIGEAQRGRALDVMTRAVERITSLVDNLRTFARVGGPILEAVEVGTVVRMARELTAGAHRRGVPVVCPPNLYVRGNAARLEQVVINLVANALQSDGDPVSVEVLALDEDRVCIEVRDRGPGVPPEIRHRIFEPFFTTRPPGQGTGLGLSISARIVQEHEGRIEVQDNPGGGAVFRVVLPRYYPPPPS